MEHITIHMFRKFAIYYQGREITRPLSKSPKSISLLKYLILNKDTPISISKLIEVFWNEESGSNPESALKTLISRTRKALSKEDPKLRDCIVTDKGTYQWKPPFSCEIDVFAFEELCQRILTYSCEGPGCRDQFGQILQLYRGNLETSSSEEWLRGWSIYYQEMYLKLVFRFIDYLKEGKDYEGVINICRSALNIDPFDENLNLELMYALKETKQNNAAMIHYRHATNMYDKYLGLGPTEKMLEFYTLLTKSDAGIKDNMDTIKSNLLSQNPDDRAFVCDYYIFKDIYQIQIRNAERWGVQMFLAMAMVEHVEPGEEFTPLVLDHIMQDLLKVLISNLRKGDIITRYSPSQFAVLLQMSSQLDGDMVTERLRERFQEINSNLCARLVFQVDPVIEERLMQSHWA